ncbi:uncharacterized protein LOC141664835 [Apium graveolens]|uniref:uncharacterized protein LOC141664835 n=1 Tax=Apium graveolens TaxID=4045 RepID=UPI003D7A32AD
MFSRIHSVEEVMVNQEEDIVQKKINGEKLEERSEILQSLKSNPKARPINRVVNMIFKNQIERTMEVYVDDMLVKSKEANDHIEHLMEMVSILRRFRIKLNPQNACLVFSHANVRNSLWTPECEEAFRRIKEQSGNPPMLSKPLDGEPLILYLAVSEYLISAVLHNAETRCTIMEKLVYSLILASTKLRPYFQAHIIEVRTIYPLQQVLHKPESSGRILKWVVELGQFDLEYTPSTTIKWQALADLLLEFDSEVNDKALMALHLSHPEEVLEEFPHPWWILHVDGAINNGGAGAGIVLVSPEGHHLMSVIHFKFHAINNDAEYEALINGLKVDLEMGVNVGFQARGPRTKLYLRCTQRLIGRFKEVRLECVPWEKDNNADVLAKMGSQQEVVLLGSIPLEIQEIPSIPEVEVTLLEDKFKARRLRYQDTRYVVYDEVLYKRDFNQPLLRCVDEEEGNYILREVHEGFCGNHSGVNSLAMKFLCQSYYLPTMKEDAVNFIRACDCCQCFANYSSMPATLLTPMVSP